jgi:RNA:NAD 2'-phosphotransferase (TPT1/KptA family)
MRDKSRIKCARFTTIINQRNLLGDVTENDKKKRELIHTFRACASEGFRNFTACLPEVLLVHLKTNIIYFMLQSTTE